MAQYSIFNKKTGALKCVIGIPKGLGPPKVSDGQIFLSGDHKGKILVGDKIIFKPKSKITLTGTKLENLPNPTTVTISGNGATFRETITDGVLRFNIDTPGEYLVRCESDVELPAEFKVTL